MIASARMAASPDPVRLKAAQARFAAFFRELCSMFVEREDVLMQIALALLCREHVLLTGPPGTAKSLLASSVLGRLIDEETGGPSLYARQFTESTVQTDLVGPINFKTLTETGRTEHFTDEGILGAAHAFLDEVFDGRDMLLRATLNVLHERELKQGTRITKGRFECAVMASNRYIADVIESSRETLLAFVDRIAFIGFVPRGFADPQNLFAVLRGQMGGSGRPALEAPLTIQDLDALQAAVDAVFISDPICQHLATLLDLLDAELHAAERADPSFLPTRYLSTRTAVRSGRILRAICVYDMIFRDPSRVLEVTPQDLMGLRLHMLLSGPAPHQVAKLLERETDPRERRQLSILRTEREIFDRCWAKLPPIRFTPRAPAEPVVEDKPSASAASPPEAAKVEEQASSVSSASSSTSSSSTSSSSIPGAEAIEIGDTKQILAAMKALVPISHGGGAEAERAAATLKRAAAALSAKAIRAHLASGGEDRSSLVSAMNELATLADAIEGGGGSMRPLARWVRARALALIGDAAGYSLGVPAYELEAATSSRGGESAEERSWSDAAMERARRRVEEVESLAVQRGLLLAKGADPAGRKEADEAWARGIAAAEDDAVILCDAALREAAEVKLSSEGAAKGGDLARVLADLAPDLDRIEALDRRLEALREGPSTLKKRAVGERVGLLIAASFARLRGVDRAALGQQMDTMLGVLRRARLAGVINPSEWLVLTAEMLVRSEGALVGGAEGAEGSAPRAEGAPSYEGYRALRAESERISSAYALAEVALRVAPELAVAGPAPGDGLAAIAELLASMPEPLRSKAVALDMDRISRALAYLEAWWTALSREAPADPDAREVHLKQLVSSRFFRVLLDESALVRFVLEARLIAELFPDRAPQAAALRARVDALQEGARRRVLDLVRARADAAWAGTLGDSAASPVKVGPPRVS